MTEKPRIILDTPNDDTPGYIWRLRRSLDLKSQLEAADTTAQEMSKLFEQIVDELILPYVIEPKNKTKARELILGPRGLSKNEYYEVLGISDIPVDGESPLVENKPKRGKKKITN